MRYQGFKHLLEYLAGTFPDQTAFFYGEKETVPVSYRDFYRQVLVRSEELKNTGTCIGIPAVSTPECIAEIFAANLAGLQVVMLDPLLKKEELTEASEYTEMDLLYGKPEIPLPEIKNSHARPGNILFFTSGTTGKNKAVVLTDHSLMQSAYNGGQMLGLEKTDRMLSVLPLSHVFGFVCSLLWPMTFGVPVCLGRGMRHYDDDCAWYRPTVICAVPSLLQFLIRHDCLNEEMRLILVGAGDCPDELMEEVKKRGIQLSFGYGLTETSSGVAISTGADPRSMSICPDDTVTIAEDGEILAASETCMMQGYYRYPEDTAAVLKNGVLSTGDLGYLDENGKLHLAGRKKDILVMSDGTKIFLPEYEGALSRIAGTDQLAVILKNGKPFLILETCSDMDALLKSIDEFNRDQPFGRKLSGAAAVNHPLPRSASGKIQRWKLEKEMG